MQQQPIMKSFPISVENYLAEEQESEVKHEYVNGYIYAMVGSSRRHNLLNVTLTTLFKMHLTGTGCQVFASVMKVKAGASTDDIFFYPDVVVSCSSNSQNPYIEEEPKLIVEILSPSTEKYDRLAKLDAYTKISSLEEYLLVDQNDLKIDLYQHDKGQWKLTRYSQGDELHLSSIDYSVAVSTIYQDVIGTI
ncbi:MAG: Uma2 family endonuclease [Endozoicomonas sp.]